MKLESLEALKDFWVSEEKRTFSGWDFSSIGDRSEEEPLPWSYKALVFQHLKPQDRLLDMGTGGGEFLLTLGHPHGQTAVTEAYRPNYDLCVEKLEPLGIEVKLVEDDRQLNFEDESFDIIINRHEAFDIDEVKRILKKGGIFLTQQVGPLNNYEFSKYLLGDLDRLPSGTNDYHNELGKVINRDFELIDTAEYFPYLRFLDVGALVYFAKIIEWEFPEFSVEKTLDKLQACHEMVQTQGYVESQEHRYLIIARKK